MERRSFPPLEGEFSQALLRSAEGDAPSNAAYAKAAAALGVSLGLGVGALSLPPTAVAAGAAGVAGAARWSGSLLARLAVFGTSGALLVGGGVFALHHYRGGVMPVNSTKAGVLAPLRAIASNSPPGGSEMARPEVAVLGGAESTAAAAAAQVPLSPAPASRRSARPAGSALRASSGSSLAEQVQSLDRARVALGSGDGGAALREIAHYRQAWPRGVFLTEASVLEIEALAARGERTRAASLAANFVASHPDSPQVERLRALVPPEKR